MSNLKAITYFYLQTGNMDEGTKETRRELRLKTLTEDMLLMSSFHTFFDDLKRELEGEINPENARFALRGPEGSETFSQDTFLSAIEDQIKKEGVNIAEPSRNEDEEQDLFKALPVLNKLHQLLVDINKHLRVGSQGKVPTSFVFFSLV